MICFALCAFVIGTISQEFARGIVIRKKNTGTDAVSALLGMVIRGRRRYGGYVVHVGIVLMFVGFAGTAYQKESEVRVEPGTEAKVGKYTIRFDRLAHEEDRQKEMVTGEVTALVDGKVFDHLRPAKWFFHNHESEPTTEVAIRRSPAEDLYVTLGGYDLAEGNATLKVVVNPVVDWIWFGFMLLAIGTAIALIPDSVLDRLTVRVPARDKAGASGSSVAGLIIWLAVGATAAGLVPGLGERAAHAQAPAAPTGPMAQIADTDLRPPSPQGRRRELAGAQHHLPVRLVPAQPARVRVGRLRLRRARTHRGSQPARAGQDTRRSHPVLHHQVRQPGRAGVADRQGLQSPGLGCCPMAWRWRRRACWATAPIGCRAARRRWLPAGPPMAVSDPDLQDKLEDELRNLD